jgi:hypothetical protein
MIIAYPKFPGVGKRFLSSLYYEAHQNNHGNHCNPINPGSDKISNPAANKINPLSLIPEAREASKIIMVIIVIS